MSDIAERLQELEPSMTVGKDCRDARIEIERLRAELAALQVRCRTYRKALRELNRAHAVLWRVIAIRNDRCSDAIREMATSAKPE
jgi:hypothetical protein